MAKLTPDLAAAATQLNAYWAARLGWPKSLLACATADCHSIAQQQQRCGHLLIDGVLGPKSRAALCRNRWQPPATGFLLAHGVKYPTPFPTINFTEPQGMSFYGHSGWLPRECPHVDTIDLVVLHWDECISSNHCFAVLLARQLSVHLMVDADGTVYQALDLIDAQAWHARSHNPRSIGIEVQNPLLHRPGLGVCPARSWVTETCAHTGHPFGHLDFTLAQKNTVAALAAWLCTHLNIDAVLPQNAAGHVPTSLCGLPFSGVCGHYHLQTDKVDPGMTLWPTVAESLQELKRRAEPNT